jgi:hypothetical protein
LFNATAHQRNGYLASDEVLSAVVIHSGGTIGRMHGYADYMDDHSQPLLVRHQMKQLYGQSATGR